ncbi:MAG TPA: MerR family transcriptional regulator [Nocardioides sp.]
MRSNEVARLAGVSVRTLRHYHQLGILPEPARSTNGYRSYTLADVGRLLRIRRLVDVGVPLERVPEFLELSGTPENDGGMDGDALLAELDGELAAAIDRLQRRRDEIARLRLERRRPDEPPGMAALAAFGARAGSGLAEFERDASQLVARLTSDTHGADMEQFAASLLAADGGSGLVEVVERFQDLPADADDAAIGAVVEDYVALLRPALAGFLASASGRRLRAADTVELADLMDDPRLNAAQAEALRLLGDRLDDEA